ncbi:putative reverse transcriptase domain-containing protein [Tanacetum coccineum]
MVQETHASRVSAQQAWTHCPPPSHQNIRRVKPMVTLVLQARNPLMDQNQKMLCNKCKFHHNGPCTVKCANCKRVGHLTRDCWSSAATNNQRTLTCYECGNQGHYKSDCPKLKNRNHGNQAEGTGTHGMVLALGGGETDQDPNNIEDEIEA